MGKALETVDMLKCCSPAARNKCPQVVRGEPRAAWLGVTLHLEEGVLAEAGAGEEPTEETADVVICREDGAGDGEASRSPDSILLKDPQLCDITALQAYFRHFMYPPSRQLLFKIALCFPRFAFEDSARRL